MYDFVDNDSKLMLNCLCYFVNLGASFHNVEIVYVSGAMSSRSRRTLYVGNLPGDIREREVEDLFYKV